MDDLDDFELIPLSDDSRGYPALDNEVRLDSLDTGHLPALPEDHGSLLFDSAQALSQARVIFEDSDGRVGSEWTDGYLIERRVVEGKLPLGPGWRVLDSGWTGLALSRERAAREYQTINLLHADRPGTLRAEFDIARGTGRFTVLFGVPEYLRIEDLFECPPLTVEFADKELARFDPAGGLTGWQIQDVDLAGADATGKLSISMTATTNRPAVGCVRLIGFE
jgi:hypothetical protein